MNAYCACVLAIAVTLWPGTVLANDRDVCHERLTYNWFEPGPVNDPAMVAACRRLAESGDGFGQFALAMMYRLGIGLPQSSAEALKWFRRGADQGDVMAMRYIGDIYREGEGVPQNNVQAYMWYDLAAANGDAEAIEERDRLAKQLTKKQLAEALRMEQEWKSQHKSAE